MKLVFFGSPEFALPALELLNSKHEVCLAVTQPDRPKGRGRKLEGTAVAKFCEANGIPYINPVAVKTASFAEKLEATGADYGIVVAYGRILTDRVLNAFKNGCLNIHPSLLPLFRGPAPVNHALLEGCTESGVTIMQVGSEMDAGDIICQNKFDISSYKSAGELLDFCAVIGAQMLCDVLDSEEKTGMLLPRIPQDNKLATYAGALETQSARIDWTQRADKVCAHIRGYDPRPGAWTVYKDERIKLFHPQVFKAAGKPGEILGMSSNGLIVACKEGSVIINELQMPSKVRMTFKAAFAGNSFDTGSFMEVF